MHLVGNTHKVSFDRALSDTKLRGDIPVISLAKREEEIFINGRPKPLKLPATSPVRKLLQYVRDEAHRFAQHYHHLLRSKKLLGE